MIQIKQGSTVLHKVKEFTFQEGEMSDATITLNLQLPASTAPNFAKDMYVEYLGEKFYLTNTKPQGVKDISSILYTYSLIFDSERSELKRRMVRDLANIGNDTYVSQVLIFSLNLTLAEFFALIQRNLTDCFGDKWVVDIYSGLSQPNSVKIDVSNTYIWDLMLKTYEFYGVRWTITSALGAMYINVGYPAQEVGHQFEYGSTTGLTKITRETSNDKIINRLRGTGGTRNVPVNYFTDRYSEFTPDPNPIPGFLSFKNIMPKCFRDSIIAETDYVDYVEDSALVTQYGVIEDGLEPNEDIYPSIEGVTVTGLGRIDEIVSAEIIEFDDPTAEGISAIASIDSVATVPYVIPATGTRGTSTNTKTTTVDTENFTIAEQCITAKFNLQYIDQLENSHMPTGSYVFKTKDGKEITITGEPTTLSATVLLIKVSNNATVATFNFTKADVSITKELVCKNLVPGEYKFRVTSYATGALAADSRTLTWSAKATLYNIMNSSGIYKPTFDIWVKDIQFDLRETNQDGTPKYASLDDAKIAFKSGALAGYEFVILQTDGQFAVTLDTSRSLNGVPSKYKISLIKSDEEYKANGMMIPNTSVHAYPTSADLLPTYGDKFVILDIQMPQSYISNAEQRVQDYLEAQLDILKVVEPTYTIELLDSFLANNPAIAADIRAGNIVTIADSVLIGGSASLYINSVTISKKDLLPKYTVTVTNKRTVNGSTVQRIQAQIDSLYTGQYSSAQSLETSILALKNKFLQKNIEDVAFEKVTFKKGAVVSHIETDNFSQGQFGGAGGAMYKDSDGSSVIEVDRLRVRKEAVFNELVINQIKFQGGIVVYSAANMEVSRVEAVEDDYRLYFDMKGGTVHNQFEVGDIIRCQRLSYSNGDSKYYATIITDLGTDFIHISNYSKNPTCTLNPEVGDQIVQFGHISDVNRQSIIEVDVLNGGRQTFYQKVRTYDLTNKNYIDLGMVYKDGAWKNMIRAFGNAYIGARDESSYIKFEEDGTMDIRANVSFKSPVAGGGFEYKEIPIALENAIDSIQIGGRNLLRNSYGLKTNTITGNPLEVARYLTADSFLGGVEYCFQFKVKVLSADTRLHLTLTSMQPDGVMWGFRFTENSIITTTEYKIYSATIKPSSDIPSGVYFGIYAEPDCSLINVEWVMIQKGNKAVDWVAAPEDITANIAAAQQAAIDEIEQYAAIIDSNMADFQAQLDGVVDSYFHEYSPLTTNEPWATWLAATDPTAEQNNHIGDTFTNITEFVDVETTPDAGKSWRFVVDENGFRWVRIQDSEAAAALALAGEAKDTADGKRRVFVATPTVPYDIGDLWTGGSTGDLKKCIVAKSISGTYSASDWGLATKYTDDTAANAAQTAANNAASAASAASTAASNAQTSANGANALLTDIADDNKLTPLDKQLAKKEWDVIVSEKTKIDAQADVYVVSKTAYGIAYSNLNTYLNVTVTSPNTTALLASLSTTSVIVGADFRAIFKAYYDARQDILNAISTAAKTYAKGLVDDIEIGGANLYDKTDVPVKITTGGTINKLTDYEWLLTGAQNDPVVVFRIWNVITENGWWTVSFDLRGSQNGVVPISVEICDYGAGSADTTADNEYKRVSFTANVHNYTAELYNFVDINCPEWVYYFIRNIQIEKGNKATDWKPSKADTDAIIANAQQTAEDAADDAAFAITEANAANNAIAAISSDGVLSANEKGGERERWNTLTAERAGIISQATAFNILYKTGNTHYIYSTAIATLARYLNNNNTIAVGATPLWLQDSQLSVNTPIVGATYRSKWESFYNARTNLLNEIAVKAKEIAISTAATDATNKSATAQTNAINASLEYGTGKNLFPQAEFANGLDDWSYGYSFLPLNVSGKGVNLNSSWALNGNTNLRNNQGLNTAFMVHGAWVDEDSHYAYLLSQDIKGIQGGKKYIASIYASNHRAILVEFYIAFYNSNGSWLGDSYGQSTSRCYDYEANGGQNINGYKRLYAVISAPQDSVMARMGIHKHGTSEGNSDSYMFVCRPMLEQVAEQTTKPGVWTPYASGAEVAESKALAIAAKATADAQAYLKAAMQADNTTIEGGLLGTTLLQMKNGATNEITGGMSGLQADNIGFWTGGTYEQALANLAKIILRKDGSGQLAGGKIKSGINGEMEIGDFSIEDGEITGTNSANIQSIRLALNKLLPELSSLSATTKYLINDDQAPIFEAGVSITKRISRELQYQAMLPFPATISCASGFSNYYEYSNPSAINSIQSGATFTIKKNGVTIASQNSTSPYFDLTISKAGLVEVDVTIWIDVVINPGASTDITLYADGNTNMTYTGNIEQTMIAKDGFYSVFSNALYFYFSKTLGLKYRGAWDVPAGLGGASINSSGVVVSVWGKITSTGLVVKSGSNYTITHNIGDTDYSLILTPKSTNVPYFLDANRGANTVVVTCAGGFDFVLIRTK